MRRVVVVGMHCLSSLGTEWKNIKDSLYAGKTGIKVMNEWDRYKGLNTKLAGPINDFIAPDHYSRKKTRGMGRMAIMATNATEMALQHAGLLGEECVSDGSMGIAYGSSSGSTHAMMAFGSMLSDGDVGDLNATTYIRMMGHTAAVNVSLFFGITGRLINTSTACTSASQGIGYAYETIKNGKQLLMVAGGAEALCPTQAAVFDTLYATSLQNDAPHLTPRPFDKRRDGLVIGEGAATLILEDFEHAKARGANILAEIIGYATNCDAAHITQPAAKTISIVMKQALKDANIPASEIGYISAHGTATELGDIAESHATHAIYGGNVPISSMKSYFGHTLGACGALESVLSIEMMHDNWFAGTANLTEICEECADLDYLTMQGRNIDIEYIANNNFAFGGINTSLIFRRCR